MYNPLQFKEDPFLPVAGGFLRHIRFVLKQVSRIYLVKVSSFNVYLYIC